MSVQDSAGTFLKLLDQVAVERHSLFRIDDGSACLDANALRLGIERRAKTLARGGVHPGDRILLSAVNSVDWVVSFFAIMRAGAIAAPVNPASTVRERRAVAEIIAPVGVISDAPEAWRDTVPIFSVVDDPVGDGSDAPLPPLSGTDRALILFTSGTTGKPKAAVQSHSTLLYAGQGTAHWLGLDSHDVVLTCMPFFHANGIYYSLMGAISAKARMYIGPRFSASSFWHTVRQSGATEVNLLGPMLTMLLRQPARSDDFDHRLRLVYTAGAPVKVSTAFSIRFGVEVLEGYGLTETPYGCINPRGGAKPGSIGLPRQHPTRAFSNSVAIVDEKGEPVPDRAVGEIVIRNAATILEYWNDSESTAVAFRGGWLRTGDLAYRDTDGYFYIVGRSKEMIRRKGVNIAPAEIELLLRELPGVDDAALIGMPSDLGDEEAIAVVAIDPRLRDDGIEARILAAIRSVVSREKWPDEVVVIDALPKTPTHRVERGVLREWLKQTRRKEIKNAQSQDPK